MHVMTQEGTTYVHCTARFTETDYCQSDEG